jgi:non-ribosomal peptide synthetase component F
MTTSGEWEELSKETAMSHSKDHLAPSEGFTMVSCLHEFFEQRVVRMREAVAVIYEGLRLSSAEFNARANQLAHYLRGLGVRFEVLVAVYVKRSLAMVVGLLGFLGVPIGDSRHAASF